MLLSASDRTQGSYLMIGGLMKTTSRFAVAAAASLLATSAMAADLGGNCCADLEERVAELEATTARKGNRKVSLTVYGQVNKNLLWHDDEFGYRDGKLTVRDNDAGMSRIGFRGEAKIRPDLTAGYQLEIGVFEDNGTTSGADSFLIRHNYLYLDSQTMGRVSLGQTSQVTDGLYEINLATVHVTPGGEDESAFFLHDHYGAVFANGFDGSRKQGVYYRTPTFAGFVLSAGWSHDTGEFSEGDIIVPHVVGGDDVTNSDDYWEVALRYAGEFNGIRVAAGIGYRAKDDNPTVGNGTDTETILGSGSVMHTPTGLFLSGGYATFDSDDNDADKDGYWVMAGVERNFFGPGTTTVFAEYSVVDFDRNVIPGFFNDNQDGTYWGLGVVQKIDAAAMDLYLNFRNYEIDASKNARGWGPDSEDANVVVGGAIIRF
ncbi:MAG: porin [Hyphomicrobiaceae bacterium]|nr:porin [Hyphomicrobiaceae bacterium]